MTAFFAEKTTPTEVAVHRRQMTPAAGLPAFDVALSCEPHRVRTARRVTATWARQHCRLPEDQVDGLALIVSELCTNAVLHGRSASFAVRGWMPTYLWVCLEVCDHTPSAVPVPQDAGPEAVSGRGLFLVEALVSDWKGAWGFSPDGSAVWCRVPAVRPCFDVPIEEFNA
ncbi:ATP-binding protein [Streptomyces sp. NPDC051041]|uniref:ATP-binding protein n=1 Tax=Streptomyces sp. NPDC051041 TaxID=3365640 RepID=UPI00379A5873